MTRTMRVWAPQARSVEIEVNGRRHVMAPEERGWFAVEIDIGVDDAYMFVLDGGRPRPDPRSAHQPHGVHGPSQVVDHDGFRWSDGAWRGLALRDAVIYELHTGTFTPEGTFSAAVDRLDHLVDLGVDAVEIMPVAEFAGRRGWGYDGVDLFAPHHAYGGPDGLKTLVDACHRRGLAVIMDVVYNHVGPEGNYLGEYGPYHNGRYSTPWGDAMNYDGPGSDDVRGFALDNATMWLRDYHCDGLRLDAVHAIFDMSAVHLLEAIATRVAQLAAELGRQLWVIAESDLNDPRVVRDRDHGGYGIEAQWSDDFHHALHALLTGERGGYYADFGDAGDVTAALEHAFVYTGQYSRYRQRSHGRSIGSLPLTAFLGYAQNHDQVGNRAAGERLAHLVPPARARMAAALVLLSPFVPLLFQGEEWAASAPFQYFTDLGDDWLRRFVSEGRRHEFAGFGWDPKDVPDPQDVATFMRSKLDWDEVERGEHAAMLRWYRDLIALRRATPALRSGDAAQVRTRCDPDQPLIVYGNAGLVVACNLGTTPACVPEADGAELLLGSSGMRAGAAPELPPDAVAVWRSRA